MSTQSDLQLLQNVMNGLNSNPVARLSYTQTAFDSDQADGVDIFDRNADQNIPRAGKTDYNQSILDKGVRSQGSSIPRMGWNHYVGRLSYNVNKLVQKLFQFFGMYRATLAHNANEYDVSAYYKTGDICYTVETVDGVKVYTWHQRISAGPETIINIPPSVQAHWAEMQEKTSYSSLLPFSAPGYRYKYTVIDLSNSQNYQANKWYPVTTALQDFEAKTVETKEGAPQVLIEAYCNGTVPGVTGPHRAELAVLSKFTGFPESSTDMLLNYSFVDQETGAARDLSVAPIGYSKLVKGRQAVLWLRGGARYALWNSFGSSFTLHSSQYSNGTDSDVLVPADAKPLSFVFGLFKARVKTTDAVETDDAVSKAQVDGSLPLPRALTAGANLRSVRMPGVYTAVESNTANSVQEMPVANPGVFELEVKGDKEGLSVTTQKVTIRSSGDEFTRILAGNVVMVPWYLSGSPRGTDIGVSGLYRFDVEDGNLLMHYRDGDQVPSFWINSNGELNADIQ